MDSKHTPGPWDYVIADNAEIPFVSVTDQNGDAIAYLVEGVGINAEANARLIAAAPAMLEALRDIAAYVSERPAGAELDRVSAEQMAAIASTILARIDGP